MGVKENAEASAIRCFGRLREKHGIRAVVLGLLISQIDIVIEGAGLSKEEWQTLIQEL